MSAPTASSPMAWWLAYPEVWAAEQAALTAAGATWSGESTTSPAESDDAPGAPPRMVLHVDWPHPSRQPGDPATLRLEVTFSAAAPWFAPTVVLPEPLTGLDRHRNPATGQLCLLAHPDDWQAGRTLADLLTAQLPRLLAAGRDPGAGPATLALEAGAEPAWAVTRLSLGGLLVETNCTPAADVPGGWAELVTVSSSRIAPVSALITVEDFNERVLWAGDAFSGSGARRIPWVRLPDLPDSGLDGPSLWALAASRLAELLADSSADSGPDLVAVLVTGEGSNRQPREEWLLLARGVPRPRTGGTLSAPTDSVGADAPPAQPGGEQLTLFDGVRPSPPVRVRRSYAIDRGALTARLPGDTTRLADASVTVVGVGALGGPVALELARAGVGRLHLQDGDLHDPATGARQLPTMRDAGMPKALAVALNLIDVNPHLHLTTGLRYLGDDEGSELPGLIASSLVIDCSASSAVSRFLAAHLRETGTPLLIASATAGAWGGAITALPAAGGGCWECLQLHRAVRTTVPWPPARPDGRLVPAGCSAETFVGAWHDSLGHVALQTARTAMALLTAPADGTAADPTANPYGDLQVVSLYRRGRPVHPRWQTRQLTIHPDCPLHQTRSQQRRIALTGRCQ
ncbi:ThiF family adenylyltransferase [Blastococcus sp. BMG 814]|uniref:ThiF family adenylyltransferase n=1 Tax=Blastococcus carthaginiensis TaxID=3050034 RepID=A0ABT9IGY1_9ACTN|nr:ThiF family adenylyltransferase [Blastococcus carthaginiensis]MDP5184834.1 ThiF family adenylyltransferase [Blastococcus carthaginiensis]